MGRDANGPGYKRAGIQESLGCKWARMQKGRDAKWSGCKSPQDAKGPGCKSAGMQKCSDAKGPGCKRAGMQKGWDAKGPGWKGSGCKSTRDAIGPGCKSPRDAKVSFFKRMKNFEDAKKTRDAHFWDAKVSWPSSLSVSSRPNYYHRYSPVPPFLHCTYDCTPPLFLHEELEFRSQIELMMQHTNISILIQHILNLC